jgi:intracellular sulfur oxidation DsrE/DsrF family protein
MHPKRAARWLGITCALAIAAAGVTAQDTASPQKGPAVRDYGAVFDIKDADYLKAIFDARDTSASASGINVTFDNAARFLNMHARAGIPRARVKVAIVVRELAAKDVLKDAPYKALYKVDNPNTRLIRELVDAGAAIYLCGQTAAGRGMAKSDVDPHVKLALSAMTVTAALGAQGYTVIPQP